MSGVRDVDGRRARLATFVAALSEAFGDRTAEVARRQRDVAAGKSAAAWDEIVAQVEQQGG